MHTYAIHIHTNVPTRIYPRTKEPIKYGACADVTNDFFFEN